MIPFSINEADVDAHFRNWAASELLARGDFKREVQVGTKRSVYLPYWVGWTDLYSNYRGQRGRRVTQTLYNPKKGHYKVKQTDWTDVSGQVEHGREDFSLPAFVPAAALVGITEPWISEVRKGWDFNAALPFESGLLAGHQALRYSVEPESALLEARSARKKAIAKDIKQDIGGDVARQTGTDTGDVAVDCRLVLAPAWIVEWSFAGKTGSVIINGQNGKGAGKYVVSAGKSIALYGTLGAVVILCCGIGIVASQSDDEDDPGVGETTTAVASPFPLDTESAAEAVSTPEPSESSASPSAGAASEEAATGEAEPDPEPEPEPEPDPTTEAAEESEEQSDVYYENCDAVRAAGADPIHVGEPGYDTHLDRDGDGVGCE
ncbi:excalibur calcium-binding domain-containing protein [Glycomyces sp. NPDC021274]|uniref:excalibur calcium-binding domain-containing protein n=1 Tax=Glycomyces sp. NPDC021274 TaxID=3155120 RepID=UPI0033D088FD